MDKVNTSRVIVSGYRKKKKRGQKRNDVLQTNIDLQRMVQVDIKPEWMKDIRVVRGLTDSQQNEHSHTQDDKSKSKRIYTGYKLTSSTMTGVNGFQYKENRRYHHTGHLELCFGGFHFSPDPLQCLRYAQHHDLLKPWRLFQVEASGDICAGNDKLCSRDLSLESEIKDEKQKSDLLNNGISITKDSIHCYKDGQLHDPGWNEELKSYICAVYEKNLPSSDTFMAYSYRRGQYSLIKDCDDDTWPPVGFKTINLDS
jgi:hypothetical protein